MISFIKNHYNQWQERRFLKRHGCSTREQYDRKYDPDYNYNADRVKNFYHGYPYWHVFENGSHHCYKLLYDHGPGGHRYGYHDIQDWCKENAQHKFRMDFLRVFEQTPIGLNGAEETEWWINEIGGGDHVFIAFKDPEDFFMFKLRWS